MEPGVSMFEVFEAILFGVMFMLFGYGLFIVATPAMECYFCGGRDKLIKETYRKRCCTDCYNKGERIP